METKLKKPRLIFNEFGRPTLDIKEVNEYSHALLLEAFKSITSEEKQRYAEMVKKLKENEKK